MIARTVYALASHGLSYTPAQVRAMTQRDRDALFAVANEANDEARDRKAMAEARAKVQAARRGRR